ncbi:type IX secretion system sortase PorU [Marinilabilia rubra]|uniref:Gingipain domain-containing protein n=1 Tax=Marinilabilia rubra TaxID=2162893 RepID=A0A2U2BA44_9BACT|nr:type IX secretion system sortase PorU [Marinilabilia rubra]PWD99906.1 hypothetical protein DDZ16_08430 [Marinilabilia rubra]
MAKRAHIINFILFIGLAVVLTSTTQPENRLKKQFSKEIEWKNSFQYPEMPFTGRGFFKDDSGLPVFLISLPLPNNFAGKDFDVKITPRKWAPFEDSKLLSDITNEDLGDEAVHRIVTIQKKSFLEIEIVPFSFSNDNAFKWKKLTHFTVDISYSPTSPPASLKSGKLKYANNSKLAGGKWVKIGTTERGIHKIPYATLENWGFTNPGQVQVYGNGGDIVPMDNSKNRPDDLPVVSCMHANNAIYFFSTGLWRWQWNQDLNIFEHQAHPYSSLAYFFLSETDNAVKSPEVAEEIIAPQTHVTRKFDYLFFHEKNDENILKSGNQWFGEKFNTSITLKRDFNIVAPLIDTNSEAAFYTQVAGRANSTQAFNISINGVQQDPVYINTVSMSDYLGYYLRLADKKMVFYPESTDLSITYEYTNTGSTSIGWLDYFIVNARGNLDLASGSFIFRDHTTVGDDNITSYEIDNPGQEVIIWDVTNPVTPVKLQVTTSDNKASFKDYSDTIKEYVAFSPDLDFPVPEFIEETPNQNLHGASPADMIIVAPKEFKGQATRLANLHRQHSNLEVLVAERDQIYNEFSWGHPDPTAIRSFMKMLYDKAGDNSNDLPELLLLFGDGTFDNRYSNDKPAAPLPTYQSDNSIYQTKTYVTDDYFGFLDDEEGENLRTDRLDIGIGRFPVNTIEEATAAVDKSEAYLTAQEDGKWKTRLTFIGDDGDFNIHTRDAERLTQKISTGHPQFDINKIYFDAYKMTSGAVGKEFPEAKTKVQQSIAEGTLILNYTGHGSENNLAHERIITKTDINNWTNLDKLPLFVTATCEFSRFDNHYHTSAGEEVFLNNNGGGIALLSTTRIVYSSLNFTLNNAFYNHAFEYDTNGQPLRLGEMMRRTKIESGANTNKLNFTLLGDPALRLIYPADEVITAELNTKSVSTNQSDTIRALSHNSVFAKVTTPNGDVINDFNGTAFVTVFDKAVDTQTLGNGGNEPFEYEEFSNILFKGRATIENGSFSINFVVPQDIRYNYDHGRISYYALADDGREAAGAFNGLVIGGISSDTAFDAQGPQMDLYLNHSGFQNGQSTGPSPMLYANIFDDSGINTSGIGIGHNITLVIDENTNNPLILNDSFVANIDEYQTGQVIYQLPALEEGNHTLSLKVWDNYNNSTTETLTFKVASDHGINIRNFAAYPNPVSPGEEVYFTMQIDAPNSILNTTIQFANAAGAVTGTVEDELISNGNFIGPYRLPLEKSGWNRSGICFVRLILKTQNGKESSATLKLVPAP